MFCLPPETEANSTFKVNVATQMAYFMNIYIYITHFNGQFSVWKWMQICNVSLT